MSKYTYEDLDENIKKYDELFLSICACEKLSEKHLQLLEEEKNINVQGMNIRKSLGIYAVDPCGHRWCVNSCFNTINQNKCVLLNREIVKNTDEDVS